MSGKRLIPSPPRRQATHSSLWRKDPGNPSFHTPRLPREVLKNKIPEEILADLVSLLSSRAPHSNFKAMSLFTSLATSPLPPSNPQPQSAHEENIRQTPAEEHCREPDQRPSKLPRSSETRGTRETLTAQRSLRRPRTERKESWVGSWNRLEIL